MGYLTNELIAGSEVFQTKVLLALTKLVEANIDSTNATRRKMARALMQDIPRYVPELARLLALDGLDLDSGDAAVDTAVVGKINWLTARVIKEL